MSTQMKDTIIRLKNQIAPIGTWSNQQSATFLKRRNALANLTTLKDMEALRVISIIENAQLYAAVAILQSG